MWWQRARRAEPVREMTPFERALHAEVRRHIRDLLKTKRLSRREYKAMEHGAWIGHKATMDLLEQGARVD